MDRGENSTRLRRQLNTRTAALLAEMIALGGAAHTPAAVEFS